MRSAKFIDGALFTQASATNFAASLDFEDAASHPDVFAEMPAELLALADPTGIVSCQATGSTSFKLIFQGREPSDGMHTAH